MLAFGQDRRVVAIDATVVPVSWEDPITATRIVTIVVERLQRYS